ncbi:MAG: hypothetical protein GX549_06205 [Clostridiales bacterium]|nr:hypothetical protein [Clostridiales bacterium]
MNRKHALQREREGLETERAQLQKKIHDTEQKMNEMYSGILRQRGKPYGKSDRDPDILRISAQNDRLIARYYELTQRIGQLDKEIDAAGK